MAKNPEKIIPDMETKYFEVHLSDFDDYSPAPMDVRIRMELYRQGMRFEKEGAGIIGRDNKPLGDCERMDDMTKPDVIFYKQTLPKEDSL